MQKNTSNVSKGKFLKDRATAFTPIQCNIALCLAQGHSFLNHVEQRYNNSHTNVIFKSDLRTMNEANDNPTPPHPIENDDSNNDTPQLEDKIDPISCSISDNGDETTKKAISYQVNPFNPDFQTLPSESIPIIPFCNDFPNNCPSVDGNTYVQRDVDDSETENIANLEETPNEIPDDLLTLKSFKIDLDFTNDITPQNEIVVDDNNIFDKNHRSKLQSVQENFDIDNNTDTNKNFLPDNSPTKQSEKDSTSKNIARENLGQYLMGVVMKKFFNLIDSKIKIIINEPLEKSLAKTLQRGEDAELDNIFDMMASLAEFSLPSMLRSTFTWYERCRLQIVYEKNLLNSINLQSMQESGALDNLTQSSKDDIQQRSVTPLSVKTSSNDFRAITNDPISMPAKDAKVQGASHYVDSDCSSSSGKTSTTVNIPTNHSPSCLAPANILSGIVGAAASLIGSNSSGPGGSSLSTSSTTNGINNNTTYNNIGFTTYNHYKHAINSIISNHSYNVSSSSNTATTQSSQVRGDPQCEKFFLWEKIELAIEFVYCRVLIHTLPLFEFHPGYNDLYQKLEAGIFHHFKTASNFREQTFSNNSLNNPNLANQNLIYDLYAEVLGVLAQSRFNEIAERFLQELNDLKNKVSPTSHNQISNAIIGLLMGIKFLRVKMVPVESLEDSFKFLQVLAQYFIDTKDKEVKHALAAILVDILVPVAAKIRHEVNLPCVKQFVETLYPSAMELLTKKKHAQAIYPLTTCLYCVSQKSFFTSNWQLFLNLCLANLKNKDVKMSRIAFESLYRLLWVYMIRVRGESNSVTQSRLATIVSSLFPKGSKLLVPKDAPLNIFVKIIQFIAQQRLDFVLQEIILELLNVGKGLKIIMPERMSVGLRAFLVIADNLEQKAGEPPMPQNLLSLPSGNTIRKKKVYLNKTLSEKTALILGISPSHFNPIIKSFETIINVLDSQIGKPFLRLHSNHPKEMDELQSGDRKLKMELFRTCIAALPRLLQNNYDKKVYFADLLIRLTTHADEKMRGLSYQAIQHFFCDCSQWRILLVQSFIIFVEKNVNDTTPYLMDISLVLIAQLISNYKHFFQSNINEKAKWVSKSGSSLQKLAVISDSEVDSEIIIPFQLIESFAFITLCHSSFSYRKLAYNLIKDVGVIYELYCIHYKFQFEMGLYSVMQQKFDLVIERIQSYMKSLNISDVQIPSFKKDFLALIEYISNSSMNEHIKPNFETCDPIETIKNRGAIHDIKDVMNNIWVILLTSIVEERSQPTISPVVRTGCWNLVFSRISALSQIYDPNFILAESRASLLRSSVSKKPAYATERETYKTVWKNYLALACSTTTPRTFGTANEVRIDREKNYTRLDSFLPFNLSPSSSPETVCYPASNKVARNLLSGVDTWSSLQSQHLLRIWADYNKPNGDFFELLSTSIKVENSEIKDPVLQAVPYISPSALRDFFEHLEPVIKEAFENRQENVRRRKRREIIRLNITLVFEIIANKDTFFYTPMRELVFPFLGDERQQNTLLTNNSSDKLSDILWLYIEGMSKFLTEQIDYYISYPQPNSGISGKVNLLNINLSDKNEQNIKSKQLSNPYLYINLMSENFGDIGFLFCSFISNLFSNLEINRQYPFLVNKDHKRSELFHLFSKMSGKIGFFHENYNYKKDNFNDLSAIEITSLKAMFSVLTAGQVHDPKFLEHNNPFYNWLEFLISSTNKEICVLVQEFLTKLLILNPDSVDFLEWMIDTTYSASTPIAKMLFSVLSNSFCLRQQPIEMVPILTLTFLFVGHSDKELQRFALNILYVLDRQFYNRLSSDVNNEPSSPTSYALASKTIPSSTLFLSAEKIIEYFRDLHPELTLHFVSEIIQKIIKSSYTNRRSLFKILTPWLKNLTFKNLYYILNEIQHSKFVSRLYSNHQSNSKVKLTGRNHYKSHFYGALLDTSPDHEQTLRPFKNDRYHCLSMTEETTLFVLNNIFYLSFFCITGENNQDLKEMWKSLLCPIVNCNSCNSVDRGLHNLTCILDYAMTLALYMSSNNLPYLFSTMLIITDALQSIDISLCQNYIAFLIDMFFLQDNDNDNILPAALPSSLVISMNYLLHEINKVEKQFCPPFFKKSFVSQTFTENGDESLHFLSMDTSNEFYSTKNGINSQKIKGCAHFTPEEQYRLIQSDKNNGGDIYYIPMPPYGGYYAPLEEYLCDENMAALFQIERFMLGIIVLNQASKILDMLYDWTKFLHKIMHFTILGFDNSSPMLRQNCEELYLHLLMKLSLINHFPSVANQIGKHLMMTHINNCVDKEIKQKISSISSLEGTEETNLFDESMTQYCDHSNSLASFNFVKSKNDCRASCDSLFSETLTITPARLAELDVDIDELNRRCLNTEQEESGSDLDEAYNETKEFARSPKTLDDSKEYKTLRASATECILRIIKLFKNRLYNSIWDYEDITPICTTLNSCFAVISITKETCNLIQIITQSKLFQEKWLRFSLQFSLTCPVRHYACRSLQIYRSFGYPHLNSLDLTDLINRLADIAGETDLDVNGFFIEIILTLESCCKHILSSLINLNINDTNEKSVYCYPSENLYNNLSRSSASSVNPHLSQASTDLTLISQIDKNNSEAGLDSVNHSGIKFYNQDQKLMTPSKKLNCAKFSAKVSILSRIFWLSVGLLESDLEHEYYSGVRLLNLIFQQGLSNQSKMAQNLQTTKPLDEFHDVLEKTYKKLKWSYYKGLFSSIFKGFFSHNYKVDNWEQQMNESLLVPKMINERKDIINVKNDDNTDSLIFPSMETQLVHLLSYALQFSTYNFVNVHNENNLGYTDNDTLIQTKIKEYIADDAPQNVIDSVDIPKALIILFAYMVRAYDNPDNISIQASDSITKFCQKFPNQEALHNLAILINAYKERNFTKSSSQWTKCIINYLILAFPAEKFSFLLFSYELYEKGPFYLKSSVCDIIYNLISHIQMTEKPSDFFKTKLASFIMERPEPYLNQKILRIIKLVVKKCSILDAPKSSNVKKWAGLTTTSFVDIKILFPSQQLPGPTLNFDIDVFINPTIFDKKETICPIKEEHNSDFDGQNIGKNLKKVQESEFIKLKNQVAALLSFPQPEYIHKNNVQKGAYFKPSATNWGLYTWKKGPQSSQERVKERLSNLLQAFGRNAFISKTPSIVFAHAKDIDPNRLLTNKRNLISSSDSLTSKDYLNNIDDHSKVSSKDDISSNFTENFAGALKDFDFLDIELEKLQDDELNVYDLDNFHWTGLIRHQSLYANYPSNPSSKYSLSTCSSSMLALASTNVEKGIYSKGDIDNNEDIIVKTNGGKKLCESASCLTISYEPLNLQNNINKFNLKLGSFKSSRNVAAKNYDLMPDKTTLFIHHNLAGLLFSSSKLFFPKFTDGKDNNFCSQTKYSSPNLSMQSFCSVVKNASSCESLTFQNSNSSINISEINCSNTDNIINNAILRRTTRSEDNLNKNCKDQFHLLQKRSISISLNNLNNFYCMPIVAGDDFKPKDSNIQDIWLSFMQDFDSYLYDNDDWHKNVSQFSDVFSCMYSFIKNELTNLRNILMACVINYSKHENNKLISDIQKALKNVNYQLMDTPYVFIGKDALTILLGSYGPKNENILEFISKFRNCVIEIHEHYENYLERCGLFFNISNKVYCEGYEIKELIKLISKLHFQIYLLASTFAAFIDSLCNLNSVLSMKNISNMIYGKKHYMHRLNMKSMMDFNKSRKKSTSEKNLYCYSISKVKYCDPPNNNSMLIKSLMSDLEKSNNYHMNFDDKIEELIYNYSKILIRDNPDGIIIWPPGVISLIIMQRTVAKLASDIKPIIKNLI